VTLLTRDQILAAEDLSRELVEVPEWGGSVWVRALTGGERDDFEASCLMTKGKSSELNYRNMRAKLVVRTAVTETGERVFGDADVEALTQKSASALDRLFSVASRLSALGKEDVEELTKN
jgi:hypothetical protein